MKPSSLILFLFMLALILSCKTTQQSLRSNERITNGPFVYVYTQDKSKSDCRFNTLSADDLIMYVDRNHAGDKDDKEPRKIVSLSSSVISKVRTEDFSERFFFKVCMNKLGKVKAFRHESNHIFNVSDIEKEIMDLIYETRDGVDCVECKTERIWVKGNN